MITLTSANSPYTIKASDFSNQVGLVPLVIIAKGGGSIEINLPSVKSLGYIGSVLFITTGATTAAISTNGTDLISSEGQSITSISLTGNNSFLLLSAQTLQPSQQQNIWINSSSSSSGNGTPLSVSMTYAQLITAINTSTLIAGQQILLTDYQTAYYLQYSGTGSGGVGGEQINVGSVEGLVLTAISNSEISLVAQSILYPQDLILYQPTMPDGNYEYAASQGKGCIIKRIDQQYEISRDYDWRTILFRRWETVAGNENYWSCTPVAGAAYIDQLCFPIGTNSGQISTTYVSSLLQNHNIFNTPYWLDNTIINSYSLQNTITQASNNTVITNNGIFAGNSSKIFTNNIIVCSQISVNEINNCQNNTVTGGTYFAGNQIITLYTNILQNLGDNIIQSISNNTCLEISGNVGINITSNNMPNHNISQNNVANINANTCTADIYQNDGVAITNNSCGSIYNNLVDSISNNSNTGTIYGNIAQAITNNIGALYIYNNSVSTSIDSNNCTAITNNVCNQIINCGSSVLQVENNFVGSIDNNNNSGEITGNVGNAISQNTNGGKIGQNNVDFIVNNTNQGEISMNSGNTINSNNNGGEISSNIVLEITSNLATVTNIYQNTGQQITGNQVTGVISNNIVFRISNNTTSDIYDNISQSIANNVLTGSIWGNQVGEINQNNETVASLSSISNCNGSALTSLLLTGTINKCNGRVDTCTISASIVNHTFVNNILNKTINPTINMQNGIIPTSSIFQVSDSQYYQMELNAGAFVFTIITA